MTEYNKLVRDKIPEIITEGGMEPVTRVLSDEEYQEALIKKLAEEQQELAAAQTQVNRIEELADLKQVTMDLEVLYGPEEVELVRLKKLQERGGFAARIFLERTE